MPVVERLLAAPVSLDRIPGSGFLNQGFGLAPLHALGQELLAQRHYFLFFFLNPWGQDRCQPSRGARFFDPRQPVCELACARARGQQPPAAAIPLGGGFGGVLEPPELAHRRFEPQAALLLFELADPQQLAECD